jgi:hypothetical protein
MRMVEAELRLDEADTSDIGLLLAESDRRCGGGVNLRACVSGDVKESCCDVLARCRRSEYDDMLECDDAVPGATKTEVVDACGPAETNH